MNFFKLKSTLFSLMAIAMVTVFLSSCEENNPLPSDQIQKSETPSALYNHIEKMGEMGEMNFNLPPELDDADSETVGRYLAELTSEQIIEREESYKIEKYLESIGRIEEVYNDLGQIDLLKLSDLSKYLSEQELADYQSFDVNSVIDSRDTCIFSFTKYETVTVPLGGGLHLQTKFRILIEVCCTWYGKCRKKTKTTVVSQRVI